MYKRQLLHLVVTGIMWLAIMKNLLHVDPDYWPGMKYFVDGAHVGVGWALLLVTAILLFHAGPWGRRAPIVSGQAPVGPLPSDASNGTRNR